jgi:hypothetical protein
VARAGTRRQARTTGTPGEPADGTGWPPHLSPRPAPYRAGHGERTGIGAGALAPPGRPCLRPCAADRGVHSAKSSRLPRPIWRYRQGDREQSTARDAPPSDAGCVRAWPVEATAHDNALEGLERLLRDLCEQAMTADTKARLRTLKELDQAATTWPGPCQGRRRGVVVRSPLPMAGGSSADPTGPGRTPSQVFWRRPWRHWVPPDVQPIQRPECHRRKT